MTAFSFKETYYNRFYWNAISCDNCYACNYDVIVLQNFYNVVVIEHWWTVKIKHNRMFLLEFSYQRINF